MMGADDETVAEQDGTASWRMMQPKWSSLVVGN
jgi:hypothetical protein